MTEGTAQPPEQSRQPALESNHQTQAKPPATDAAHEDSKNTSIAQDALNLLTVAGHSFYNSAVSDPLRGAAQLSNHLFGTHLQGPAAYAMPKTRGFGVELAETIGGGAGMIAPFLLTEGSTWLATGGRLTGVSKAAVDGAVYGFALTPSDDPNKNFWTQRSFAGLTGAATFGSQRAMFEGLAPKFGLNNEVFARSSAGIASRIGLNAVSGAGAGVVNVESNSLLNDHTLRFDSSVLESAGKFAVTGLALDAAHLTIGGAAHGASKTADLLKDWAKTRQEATSRQTGLSALDTVRGAISETVPLSAAPAEAQFVAGRSGPAPAKFIPGLTSLGYKSDTLHHDALWHPPVVSLHVADMPPPTPLGEHIDAFEPTTVPRTELHAIHESAQNLQDAATHALGFEGQEVARAAGADLKHLTDQVIASRREVREAGEPKEVFEAVRDLLTARRLQVDLTPMERFGLAKQLLAESAQPRDIDQAAFMCGPTAVQKMALLTNPGKQVRAIVDVLTKGKFTTNESEPQVVDLSRRTLQRADEANGLSDVYAKMLEPDLFARMTLDRAKQAGAEPRMDSFRSYASQLAQIVNANIRSQTMPEANEPPTLFVQGGPPDPFTGDNGQRLLRLDGNDQFKPVLATNGDPVTGPQMRSRQLQSVYDKLTGNNSEANNFVLLHTLEALDSTQGTRFLGPRELEKLLIQADRPMIMEVDPDHPIFNDQTDQRAPDRQFRHVVMVEPSRTNGDTIRTRDGEPLFDVSDSYGRLRDLAGDRAVTAKDLYAASLHPHDKPLTSPRDLPGVKNYGEINDHFARGGKPEGQEGMHALKQEGVTLVVDLITNPKMDGSKTVEQTLAEKEGIKYISIRTGVSNLTTDQILKIHKAIEDEINPKDGSEPGKVFIHCKRGSDRTGATVAFWRVLNDHWPPSKALAEMREYNWGEGYYYGSRMGSMVEQQAGVSSLDQPREQRLIGEATGEKPLQAMDFHERINALRRETDRLKRTLPPNDGNVYNFIKNALIKTGLADDHWEAYLTQPKSPFDLIGADVLLVNTVSGDTHLLDMTANERKNTVSTDGRATITVPTIRRDGVIPYSGDYFETGMLANTPAAKRWAYDTNEQLKMLTSGPAYFNMSYTPFPDFRQTGPASAFEQISTFVKYLRQQDDPDRMYREMADDIEHKSLRYVERQATSFSSPAFSERVRKAAETSIIDWAMEQLTKKPAQKQQPRIETSTQRFDLLSNKMDGSAGNENFRIMFHTSDGRQADSGQLGNILLHARINVSTKSDVSVEQAKQRLEKATPAHREREEEALKRAQLTQRIQKKLDKAGLTWSDWQNFISDGRTIAMIDRGGAIESAAKGPIVSSIRQQLSGFTEDQLLGLEPPPKPTAKEKPAPKPVDPYEGLNSSKQALAGDLAQLGLPADAPSTEVAAGLELVAETTTVPDDVRSLLGQLIAAYSVGDEAAKAKVAELMAAALQSGS